MHDNLAEQILEHQFVHLRVQSSYSMLASALKVNRLAELAAKHKMPAVAMTDINNLFGSLEFSLEATKKAVQPIHGAILTLCYQELEGVPQFSEILVLAKNQTGYQNLLTLVSLPYLKNNRKFKEHITWQDLTTHQQGLIILSGYTEGPIGLELAKNNYDVAKEIAQKFLNIFSDRFYFEIMRHGLQLEQKIEHSYLELAHKLEVPLVATNKILFENIEMHEAHDVLLCIASGVVKDNTDRPRVSNQCYFKSPREMMTLFQDLPSAITNAGYIAKRCSVKAEVHDPMLPNYATEDLSEEEYLRKLAFDGLQKRLQHKFPPGNLTLEQEAEKQQYFDRLNYELDVICQMKFPGYFLIVSDFIRWSKEQGIYVGPGRGSGAGSIVAWSLLITDLDPLHFGLLFERFLNPERVSMPDFDIDFCQERREEVINYVREKYSDQRVGQIITFGKLQAKAVIKDVSRVLGLRYEYADYLTELVPFNAVNPVTLDQAINEVAELRQAYAGKGLYNLPDNKELIKQVLDTALILEGLHRHCSVHAAGIVISGRNLLEAVPLYKDLNGEMSIIQYSMKYAELAGLVKFDFLGLQTLTVLSKCLSLLHSQGITLELEKISFKDEKTYQMLAAGNSIGVFQFESVGMRDTLRKLRPDCIEDLMALGALYRPGPMDNIPTYIACKHGRQQPDYLHPMLKPLLQETYGVIVYQEQVLEIAKVLAGYSLGAADLLRRAMGKKVKAEMDAQEKLFVEGAVKNNISAEQASSIFASVAKFAGYGFNRAHAASYAVISYYTAFLKTNYPIEFFIACLNLDIRDQDQINVFLHEAKDQNIKISPPNINSSEGLFTLGLDDESNKSIIFGLGAIKNVTVNFGDEAAKERKAKGKFKSIIDFVERMSPKLITKRSLECTIKAGCFDELHPNRRQLFESIPALLALNQRYHQEQSLQQFTLFASTKSSDILANTEDYDNQTKAYLELEVLGFFITLHPITPMLDICGQQNIKTIADIKNNLPFGSSQLKLAGVILRKDARMSARGRFITMHLSDPTGMIEATIFSEEVLRQYANLINVKSAVIVTCEAFRDEGSIKLTASKFAALDNIMQDSFKTIKIKVASKDELNEVMVLLNSRQDQSQEEMNISIQMPAMGPFFADINFKSKHKFTPADLDFLNKFLIKN